MKNKNIIIGAVVALLVLLALQAISNNMYVYNVKNICNRNISSHEESKENTGVCVYDENVNMYRLEF